MDEGKKSHNHQKSIENHTFLETNQDNEFMIDILCYILRFYTLYEIHNEENLMEEKFPLFDS